MAGFCCTLRYFCYKKQDRTLNLTTQQWVLLEELTKLLEPLEGATVFFCTERKVSISCTSPIMHNVFTTLIVFKTAVREFIMRRWSLDVIEPDSPLVLAAALNPCFKSLKFLTDYFEAISQRRAITT